MSGVHVSFPSKELDGKLNAVSGKLRQEQEQILEPIGVMLLSLTQEAYDEKSQGRRGSDGEQWAGIQLGSLLARLREAGQLKATRVKGKSSEGTGPGKSNLKKETKVPSAVPLRKKQQVVYQTANQFVSAKGDARRANIQLLRGLKSLGVSFHDKKTGREISATRAARRTGTFLAVKRNRDLKQIVPPIGYQIGVDNGLQRASGSPVAKGRNEGGVFVIDTTDLIVRVGYGMKYSKYFDLRRKLIPDELPDDWVKQLEEMVGKETDIRLTKIVKQEGLS